MAEENVFAPMGLWLKRLLTAYMAVLGLESLACLAVAAMLWGADPVSARPDATDFGLLSMAISGFVQVGLFIVIAILFLRLLYKAVKKAQTFKTPFTYVSAGWAVGYWFIPLMNLYRPLDVVKALFKACAAEAGADAKPKAGEQLLSAWWALWLVSNIVNWIFARSDTDLTTTAGTLSYVEYDFGVNLLLILATVLFAMVVKRLVAAIAPANQAGG